MQRQDAFQVSEKRERSTANKKLITESLEAKKPHGSCSPPCSLRGLSVIESPSSALFILSLFNLIYGLTIIDCTAGTVLYELIQGACLYLYNLFSCVHTHTHTHTHKKLRPLCPFVSRCFISPEACRFNMIYYCLS